MRDSKKYSELVNESASFIKDWSKVSLNDLHEIPMLGAGDESPMFHDLILSELLAHHRDGSEWLSNKLISDSVDVISYARPLAAMTEISGAVLGVFDANIEAMLGLLNSMSWFSLLLRWQLQAILRVLGKETLTLNLLAKAQKNMGSPVWPNGNMLPALDVSQQIWKKQLLSDGYPALLISSNWPFYNHMQRIKVFVVRDDEGDAEWRPIIK